MAKTSGFCNAFEAVFPIPKSIRDFSVEDLMKLGRYDWTNPYITPEHFLIAAQENSGTEVEAIHFNRVMSSNDVRCELYRLGYRPADLRELLDFGAFYPKEQRNYPIAAFGSVWQCSRDYQYVACLDEYAGCRKLRLYWLANDWYVHWRFLAVRRPV